MALTKVTSGVRTLGTGEVTAANLASGVVDTSGLEDDVALLGFKVASNGSLAKYNLVDQTVDDFQDTSGVDASASTNEVRDSSGKYYSGTAVGSYSTDATTATGAGTWTAPADTLEAEILIVAGGGGGAGRYQGGGGGAGGVIHDTSYTVVPGVVYDLSVGAGGAGGSAGNDGSQGTDSVWNVNAEGSGITFTSDGGGKGSQTTNTGYSGGSGGGANYNQSTPPAATQTSPTGATGYGNAGGISDDTGWYPGGGGGGAGGAGGGTPATPEGSGGDGGVGKLFSNFVAYGTDSSNVASTGSNGGWFGGGGGGGGYPRSSASDGGAAGVGGGGKGASNDRGNGDVANTAGQANTGGGGGAGSHDASPPGLAGGSGVILIRHRSEAYNNITLVSTTTAAQAAPTKGDIVLTYTNGAGTTTLDTDLTAEISADGGSTWTALALGSEGSTGSHNIATSHDVTISSTITAPYNMAYRIKTLNQSVSKTTRIQAVSLGWS